MAAAHQLFHHDSQHILTRVTAPALGRRETAVVVCGAMLRAAGLDWYEQADVWDKVARLRAGAGTLPGGQAARLRPALYRLLTTSIRGADAG